MYRYWEFLRDPTLHLAATKSLIAQHEHLHGAIRNYQFLSWTKDTDTKSYGYSTKSSVLRIISRPETKWLGATQSVKSNTCPLNKLHIEAPRDSVSNVLNSEFILILAYSRSKMSQM